MREHLTIRRLLTLAAAAAVGLLGTVAVDVPETTASLARTACPSGQIADDEDAGYQCLADCPSGMLVDAETDNCVAAPGVPPAPLPAAVITKQPGTVAQ